MILDVDYKIYAERLVDPFTPHTYQEFEQAFWHLFTLNCYHVTMSFDVNMVLLLDWGISFHMGRER